MLNLVIQAGSAIFSTGLRLVLPLLALLLIVDISLALLARLNSQLQLITLAFPIKMLLSLGLLAWLIAGVSESVHAGVRTGSASGSAAADVVLDAMAGDSHSKTEQPTGKRLAKARIEGQFVSSREMVAATQFVVFHRGGLRLVPGLAQNHEARCCGRRWRRHLTPT